MVSEPDEQLYILKREDDPCAATEMLDCMGLNSSLVKPFIDMALDRKKLIQSLEAATLEQSCFSCRYCYQLPRADNKLPKVLEDTSFQNIFRQCWGRAMIIPSTDQLYKKLDEAVRGLVAFNAAGIAGIVALASKESPISSTLHFAGFIFLVGVFAGVAAWILGIPGPPPELPDFDRIPKSK